MPRPSPPTATAAIDELGPERTGARVQPELFTAAELPTKAGRNGKESKYLQSPSYRVALPSGAPLKMSTWQMLLARTLEGLFPHNGARSQQYEAMETAAVLDKAKEESVRNLLPADLSDLNLRRRRKLSVAYVVDGAQNEVQGTLSRVRGALLFEETATKNQYGVVAASGKKWLIEPSGARTRQIRGEVADRAAAFGGAVENVPEVQQLQSVKFLLPLLRSIGRINDVLMDTPEIPFVAARKRCRMAGEAPLGVVVRLPQWFLSSSPDDRIRHVQSLLQLYEPVCKLQTVETFLRGLVRKVHGWRDSTLEPFDLAMCLEPVLDTAGDLDLDLGEM